MKKRSLFFIVFSGFVLFATAQQNRPTNQSASATSAKAVEGWYFRAVSGYPAAVSFEPVVLFANGDCFDIGDETIESLNVAESKSKRPAAWGKWKKNGNTYLLSDEKGKTHDYKLGSGNWFPAYAYTNAIKLKPAYEKVSGGDYGNGMHALTINKITFIDATHFSQGANTGISTPNANAGKTSSSSGTYRIYNHTIELIYGNGKKVEKSFALGATGSPARPTNTMIFIGGDAFTDI